jgi:signal transduction histidine kinase
MNPMQTLLPPPIALVVTPDRSNTQIIYQALSAEFQVVLAAGWQQGLEIARRHTVDLLIADIVPEGTQGEFLQAMGREAIIADVPVILVASASLDLDLSLQRFAAQDFILMPLTEPELRERAHHAVTKKHAERIRLENTALAAEVRVKSLLLKTLSHELQTPLNSILGFTQIMHSGGDGPISVEQKEHLGYVLDSARHLRQLVGDVLDLARIAAGKMELRPVPLDLAAIVDQVKVDLAPLAVANRQTLTTIVEPGLGVVVADLVCVRQILYNYLSNAVRFSSQGGPIIVRFASDGADHFRLSVEDSGPGIAPQDIDRLFEEFQQLHLSKAARHAGSGLGLTVAKRLVEALGGSTGVDSRLGVGSVFFAVLPRVCSLADRHPKAHMN